MIKVLRPSQASNLISARVFDDHFERAFAPAIEIHPCDLDTWTKPLFAEDGAAIFAQQTAGYDFLCPNHEGIPLIPFFLEMRNRARAKIRLMFIAHAPGAYSWEWALIRPLMAPGDVIIAPTESAREIIKFLCPEIASYVRVAPHPLKPLPQTAQAQSNLLVSLSRLTPLKLVHRQIEALHLLRQPDLQMEIAGPNDNQYAYSLRHKIRRLGLENQVKLAGTIQGDEEKGRFLSSAALLINLSVTIEESFGKAIVEALGVGLPVLATDWNGFAETAGMGGTLLSVEDRGQTVDVSAQALADKIEAALSHPITAEICQTQAQRFHPDLVAPQYQQILEEALARPLMFPDLPSETLSAIPEQGLLSVTAVLHPFSWREIFQIYKEGIGGRKTFTSDQLRALMLAATQRPLSALMAKHPYAHWIKPTGQPYQPPPAIDITARIGSGAFAQATQLSRQTCLSVWRDLEYLPDLERGLETFFREGLTSTGLAYLRSEAARLKKDYEAAFQGCITEELSSETSATRLRQLARICREWEKPTLATRYLCHWLESFPDAPDSGAIWLDLCLSTPDADEKLYAYENALSQLGDSPLLQQVKESLA